MPVYPGALETLDSSAAETPGSLIEPFDVVIGELRVLFSVPRRAQPEIALQLLGYGLIQRASNKRGKALLRANEVDSGRRYIKEAEMVQVPEQRRVGG